MWSALSPSLDFWAIVLIMRVISKFNKSRLLIIGFIVILAIFVRTFRLETNSHFLADEARDLAAIHQIYVDKKLTLVGPISDDQSHVFSSLTYYLLLPFAFIYNFQPLGTVVGAVFWGLLTFAILWFLAVKINHRSLIPAGILAALWLPLVTTSRWPWNPNFVPLWISLSILLQLYHSRKSNFFSGLSAGLAFHQHFISILVSGFVWLYKKSFLWLLGIVLAISPFIIFDLRHPPGLFFPKAIGYNSNLKIPGFLDFFNRYWHSLFFARDYFFTVPVIAVVISLLILILIFNDLKNKSSSRFWLISFLLSLIVFTVYSQNTQYLLPSLPLFWMWLFSPRTKNVQKLNWLVVVLMCLCSLLKLPSVLLANDYTGNLKLVNGAAEIIRTQIQSHHLEKVNLAVLGSTDQNLNGDRFRGTLLAKNIVLESPEQNFASLTLFVITPQMVNNIQGDPAALADGFRNGPVMGDWPIPGTDWRVIQFNRY